MAAIFLDTTFLLDLYRGFQKSLKILDGLLVHKNELILTEQTICEFRRNRSGQVAGAIKALKAWIDSGSDSIPSIIRSLPQFEEVTKSFDDLKLKVSEVTKTLKQLTEEEKSDPIATRVLELAGKVQVIKLNDDAVQRAHRRKLLGNPPASPGKYTIGDELNWELLLERLTQVKNDLIIVTNDGSFHTHRFILQDEYFAKTGRRLLLVTNHLSDALKQIGQETTKELIEAEKAVDAAPPLNWLSLTLGQDDAYWVATLVNQLHQKSKTAAIQASLGNQAAQGPPFPPYGPSPE